MDLEKVKEILNPYLEENNLYLYDLKFVRESGNLILQVLVDTDSGITSDELEKCNNYLSERLDSIDSDLAEYMLEVSSPGAERDLRNDQEISKAVSKYVCVNCSGQTYLGTLESFDGETLVVRVNLKGRFKNFSIKKEEITKIRMAVKI